MYDAELLGLTDQVALVTGGGGTGMGRAHCLQLARAGCHVVVADRDGEGAQTTSEEVKSLGRQSVAVSVDVTDQDDVQRMVGEVITRFGRLDVAVNNVGSGGRDIPFLDMTRKQWDDSVALNLTATALCCQAEALAMIRSGIPGRIVNVGSSSGVVAAANISAYGAAKAGVIHLTKTLAVELARYGIRVNCIIPGVHTNPRHDQLLADPAVGETFREFFEQTARVTPLGRLGDPMDTGGLAVFFASRLSAYVTGQSLLSDGGITLTTRRPNRGFELEAKAVAGLRSQNGAASVSAS